MANCTWVSMYYFGELHHFLWSVYLNAFFAPNNTIVFSCQNYDTKNETKIIDDTYNTLYLLDTI